MKKAAASPKPLDVPPASHRSKEEDPAEKAKRDLERKRVRDEAMKAWKDKWREREQKKGGVVMDGEDSSRNTPVKVAQTA
jgi:hypothetical protein